MPLARATPDPGRSVTRDLADYARRLRYEHIGPEAAEVARHCILDWFGCTLAGSGEPLAGILSSVAGTDTSDEATVLGGTGGRSSALQAALVNGATSHALDFDDTHSRMSGHPSVPVVPAALALCERDDRSGADFLTAVVTGIEVECRAGALLNPSHYLAGFHATGTVGALGAASASAKLLDLEDERLPHALGLAATQAAGLKSSFGTMAKPLHAGKAAYEGLLSALLAADGFTGNPEILEVPQGFADTHSGGEPDVHVLDELEGRFLIRDTLFKYHAACYLTHSAIDGARELRVERSLDPGDVRSVTLEVAPTSLRVCNIQEPRTGLEGKFSLRATTAMSLLGDDTSDLATYSDARVTSAPVVSMRDRVRVEPTPGVSPTHSRVVVTTENGDELSAQVDVGVPESDLTRQKARLGEKFLSLAAPVVGDEAATRLEELVGRIDQLDELTEIVSLAASRPH